MAAARYLKIQLLLAMAMATVGYGAMAAELVRHTVSVDDHPLAVWEKSAGNSSEAVLLVHGRTWSALPDFDLQVEGEDLSLMDGLVEQGYAVYAVDLRGYGQSPRDSTGWLTPARAAEDVAGVLRWMATQRDWAQAPHLFGWSMGSTIAQLAAQRHPELQSSLTLFGYWHDPDETFPEDDPTLSPAREPNTAVAAASDFITPGSISERAVEAYVNAALAADPIRTDLRGYSDYNELDPQLLRVPTLVIAGEFDPLAPEENLARLYRRIGTGHKQWVTVPGSDHAAFLETPRRYFIIELAAFFAGAGNVSSP